MGHGYSEWRNDLNFFFIKLKITFFVIKNIRTYPNNVVDVVAIVIVAAVAVFVVVVLESLAVIKV